MSYTNLVLKIFKYCVISIIFAVICVTAIGAYHSIYFFDRTINERIPALDALDQNMLNQGATEMKKHKVVICGITRDDAQHFGKMKDYIEYLGKTFQDYRVIIFENDSTDCTKELLSMWQTQNNKIKIVSEDFHNTKRPSIKFLADARNQYIRALDKSQEYRDYDIVMMVDMDMSYGFDIRGIEHSFAQLQTWDAVCSNGVTEDDKMFDAFAFRNDEFPYTPSEVGLDKYWYGTVHQIQKKYDVLTPLMPLHSCFGGLAFYKREKIVGCQYDSIQGDCEHVAFHKCIREQNNGKIFMNPAQVVRYSHYDYFDSSIRKKIFNLLDLCAKPSMLLN